MVKKATKKKIKMVQKPAEIVGPDITEEEAQIRDLKKELAAYSGELEAVRKAVAAEKHTVQLLAGEQAKIVKDKSFTVDGVKMKVTMVESGWMPNKVVVHLENME